MLFVFAQLAAVGIPPQLLPVPQVEAVAQQARVQARRLKAVAQQAVNVDITNLGLLKPLTKRGNGVLGYERTTPETFTQSLSLHTVRNPGRQPYPWICNSSSCAVPYFYLEQLVKDDGVEVVQLILGPQLLEIRCTAEGKNLSTECPLPGYDGDRDMAYFLSTVEFALLELVRRNASSTPGIVSKVALDIWNEPNFPGKPGTGGGGFVQPANYTTFFAVWDATVKLARRLLPGVQIVGPSAAPGPGALGTKEGWPKQRAFLQAFVLSCRSSSTMPDILSWHNYYGDITIMHTMQQEMRQWFASHSIPPEDVPKMGYNEIIGPTHTLSPGYGHSPRRQFVDSVGNGWSRYAAGTLAAIERYGVDHAVRGCWTEPNDTGGGGGGDDGDDGGGDGGGFSNAGACFDGSLDGLLDMEPPGLLKPPVPRAVYWPYRWYAGMDGNRAPANVTGDGVCNGSGNGTVEVLAAANQAAGTVSILLGYAMPQSPANISITLKLPPPPPPSPLPSLLATFGNLTTAKLFVVRGDTPEAQAAPCPLPAAVGSWTVAVRSDGTIALPAFVLGPGSAAFVTLQ